MNRKQEVTAWIFGVLIVISLVVAGYLVVALVVLASLVILSLRDRKKAKPAVSEDIRRESIVDPETPEIQSPLSCISPHALAVSVVQLIVEGEPPFNAWKAAKVAIPAEQEAGFELACHFFQIRLFLDHLQVKFGAPAVGLVEKSFATLLNSDIRPNFFPDVMVAIELAKRLGPAKDGPDRIDLRQDLQISDQILRLFEDKNKSRTRLLLAQCLTSSRILAEAAFPALVRKIEFDPTSVALISLPTAYSGCSLRWSEKPGCFERYLQRKEGNPLFPESERHPSDIDIATARERDRIELLEFTGLYSELLNRAGNFKGQIPIAELNKFQREELVPLMEKAAGLAAAGSEARDTLFSLFETITDSLIEVLPDDMRQEGTKTLNELIRIHKNSSNSFFCQVGRNDTPIAPSDLVPSLLCEDVETLKALSELMTEESAQKNEARLKWATELISDAARDGFRLPAAEQKLAIMREYVVNSKPTRNSATKSVGS